MVADVDEPNADESTPNTTVNGNEIALFVSPTGATTQYPTANPPNIDTIIGFFDIVGEEEGLFGDEGQRYNVIFDICFEKERYIIIIICGLYVCLFDLFVVISCTVIGLLVPPNMDRMTEFCDIVREREGQGQQIGAVLPVPATTVTAFGGLFEIIVEKGQRRSLCGELFCTIMYSTIW